MFWWLINGFGSRAKSSCGGAEASACKGACSGANVLVDSASEASACKSACSGANALVDSAS